MAFADPVLARNRAHRQSRISANTAELKDTDAVANILAIYAQASPADIADGHKWYPTASAIADDIARLGRIDHRAAAGIIAALSPQTSWDENVRLARDFVQGEDIGHLSHCIAKATSILHGVDPDKVLRGRKVRSFFANIVRPNTGGHVTIDRHAYSIIIGRNADDRDAKRLERIGFYTLCAAAYRAAARQLGISPQSLQAITWLTWRRVKVYDRPQHAALYQKWADVDF